MPKFLDKKHKKWLWPFLSFLCGVLVAFSMAPTHLVPLLFVGFSVFYVCLYRSSSNLQGALCGFLFGFGFFLFGLHWIANALLVEGNSFAWAWPLAVCGLPAALGVFYALAGYVLRRWFALDQIWGFLGFCAVFALADWVRGHAFTGFPWNLFAYAWGDILEILQLLSLGNVYFLNILSIGWASVAGFLFLGTHNLRYKGIVAGIAVFSLILSYGFGVIRLDQNKTSYLEKQYVRIVQPDILQREKWERGKMQGHYDTLLSLSRQEENAPPLPPHSSVLIVWPETATSSFVLNHADNKENLISMLSSYGTDGGTASLLSGVLEYKDRDNISNAAVLFDKNANEVNIYRKTKLVPFGEFIPFQKWIPIPTITQFSGFRRGHGAVTNTLPSGLRYQALICYEIIFPGFSYIKNEGKPDILVNVTNDAWYGKSAGPYQHLLQARYRAIETGTPVIRSANTGISALFDPVGRILYKSDLFVEDNPLLQVPKTIVFLQYSPLLQNIVFLFMVFSIVFVGLFFGIYCSNRN